jgi:hypothetical protein
LEAAKARKANLFRLIVVFLPIVLSGILITSNANASKSLDNLAITDTPFNIIVAKEIITRNAENNVITIPEGETLTINRLLVGSGKVWAQTEFSGVTVLIKDLDHFNTTEGEDYVIKKGKNNK